MAEVLLREQLEQVRLSLRAGKYAETLALGRYVLRYFPKHVETYRLLAEASLESNDPGSAADLFERVLSADPENVISLVGLSIIFEQRQRLDQALWYLERAFEIQPANPELRKELARVYGMRDGAVRERIKLTPAALARLYARQGLYPQAIREFRAVLRSEPARLDVQVALAETLYRAGQLQEAAETASALIEKLPYCLKANLLLGALWAENGYEEGLMLLRRAWSLDPDLTLARDLFLDHWQGLKPATLPDREEAAPAAPTPAAPSLEVEAAIQLLEGLELSEEPAAAMEQESPAPSSRISPEIPTVAPAIPEAAQKLPGWLGAAQPPPAAPPAFAVPEQNLTLPWPDVLRQAAEGGSAPPEAGAEAEEATETISQPSEEVEDIPDWLRRMPLALAHEESSEEQLPDWIKQATPAEPNKQDRSPGTANSEQQAEEKAVSQIGAGLAPAPVSTEGAVLPDWLNADISGASPQSVEREALPEWLDAAQSPEPPAAQPTSSSEVISQISGTKAPELAPPPVEEPLPDWLRTAEPLPETQTLESAMAEAMVPAATPALTPSVRAEKAAAGIEALLAEARELRARGETEAAADAYEKILQNEPRRAKEAVADLEFFVQEPQAPARARRILGDAYAAVGRYKDALEQYRYVLGR